MIPTTTRERIIELLVEGQLSKRAIAYRVGVSRGTIANIARNPSIPRPKKRTRHVPLTSGPPERCPGCGGMVNLWPCLACSNEAARKTNAR